MTGEELYKEVARIFNEAHEWEGAPDKNFDWNWENVKDKEVWEIAARRITEGMKGKYSLVELKEDEKVIRVLKNSNTAGEDSSEG